MLFLRLIFCLILSLPAQAETILTGPLIQGGLVVGTTTPGASVWQDDQPVLVSRDGTFLIGFDRDMPATSQLKIRQPDGQTEYRTLPIEQRQYAIQRIQLPDHKVAPMTPQAVRHVRRDSRLLKQARRRNDDRQDFSAGFIWPATGRISGVYGSQRILNGQKKRPHYGVDVARPTGTPVVAPAAGIITVAEPDMFYSGGTLVIDHGHQLTSALLHLSELAVRVGDQVQQGQLVGRIGATGRATGPHLDWRMKLRQHQVDPQLLVPPMPGTTP
ncbi:MAG: M23 family metallopeptidase [Pseudomonadota bacterium]